MKAGDLLIDEQTDIYVLFLGYNQWNEIMVMYPDGYIYQGCELHFKEL